MKTTNYILADDWTFGPSVDSRTIPKGAFVCPIQDWNLPAHIKNSLEYKSFDIKREVWCYTRYGIIAIKRELVEVRE